LDIGAGSGRDARYLESKGLKVFAVEPALDLMELAIKRSQHWDIIWLQDSLPTLDEVKSLGIKFNLILLSAVWMHLSPEDRHASIETLAPLLEIRGKLVVTLRHGEFSDGRTAFPVIADEVKELGDKLGLTVILKTEPTKDQLGRNDVAWQTLVLEK
jgi:SAM-dependent methyltransferase